MQGEQILHYQDELITKQTQLLIIGNSITKAGLDEESIEKAVNLRCTKIVSNGSASAWWFLFIKNVLEPIEPAPKILVIGFRDAFLTHPSFRTDAQYLPAIRSLFSDNEAIYQKKVGNQNAKQGLFDWIRGESKYRFDRKIRRIYEKYFGFKRDSLPGMLDQVLLQDEKAQTQKQLTQENVTNPKLLNFSENIESSFLPDMLNIIEKKDMQVIFLRMPRRSILDKKNDTPELQVYINELAEYLEKKPKTYFIDLSREPDLSDSSFGPGDHLNEEGKKIISKAFLKAFLNLEIKKKS